jgi:hypothetical protein
MLDSPPPIYHLCEQRQSDVVKVIDCKVPLAVEYRAKATGVLNSEANKQLKPLSFASQKFTFSWNQLIPLNVEVDGLIVQSIIFRKQKFNILKNIEFGTKGMITVTNQANNVRTPGFAVAVFDVENRLLGVASGGPKISGIKPGKSKTFDLAFDNVIEQITKGSYFYFSVELPS